MARKKFPWSDWDRYSWGQALAKSPRKIIVIPLNWPSENPLIKLKNIAEEKRKKEADRKKREKRKGQGGKLPKEYPPYTPPQKTQFDDWDDYDAWLKRIKK